MKVIDLLNKIANGEIDYEQQIKIDNKIINVSVLLGSYIFCKERLNDEVEIIEEDKKIEKIQTIGSKWYSEYIEGYFDEEENYSAYDECLMNKINEIIDKVNKIGE